jgi:hypothetical protein
VLENMPKKKSTTTKKSSSPKKAQSSKKTVAKAKTASSKVASNANTVDYKDLFYGTMSAIAVYVFALWAIDSGNLWVYGLTFASVYYTVHYYRLFLRNKFFNNDKTASTRTTKK